MVPAKKSNAEAAGLWQEQDEAQSSGFFWFGWILLSRPCGAVVLEPPRGLLALPGSSPSLVTAACGAPRPLQTSFMAS